MNIECQKDKLPSSLGRSREILPAQGGHDISLARLPALLTIAIPTFNRVQDLATCLDSVVAAWEPTMAGQVELLVCSNASNDGTDELVARWQHPSLCLRYHRWAENVGPVANFLELAELSQTKFCWLFADDDILETHAIRHVLAILSANPDCGGLTVGYSAWDSEMSRCVNRPNLADGRDIVIHSDPPVVWRHCLHEWGFLSVCIINTKLWKECLPAISLEHAGAYPHVWIQSEMSLRCRSWCYSGAHLVRWRMDRDSFLRDHGALKRALMPLDSYGRLAQFYRKSRPTLSAQALAMCCGTARHYIRRFKTDWNSGCLFSPREVYALMTRCLSYSGWRSPAFYYDTLPTFFLPATVGRLLRFLKSKVLGNRVSPVESPI